MIINFILLYTIISFAVIPYLDRGGSLEEFQLFYRKQTPALVHTPISTATRATVIPSPTFYCSTRSCSKTRYHNT